MIEAGNILKCARKQSGLKQVDAAIAYGVSERTYQRWENNEIQPKFVDVVGLIEGVFKVEFRDLVR